MGSVPLPSIVRRGRIVERERTLDTWRASDPPEPPTGHGGPRGDQAPTNRRPAEEVEALRELHDRLAATPVVDVIVNHAIGIWQLALVHLGVDHAARRPTAAGPAPDLASAGLAIDALAALVDGLGERLGEGEQMLREALGQAQMLFVEMAETEA